MIHPDRWIWLVRLSIVLLAGAGCLDEAADRPAASLDGSWRVAGATRSGRSTNTLDSAVFTFDTSAHRLTTDFTGELLQLAYARRDNRIEVENPLLSELDITALTDSTLNFHTIISGTRFSFRLVPAEAR